MHNLITFSIVFTNKNRWGHFEPPPRLHTNNKKGGRHPPNGPHTATKKKERWCPLDPPPPPSKLRSVNPPSKLRLIIAVTDKVEQLVGAAVLDVDDGAPPLRPVPHDPQHQGEHDTRQPLSG